MVAKIKDKSLLSELLCSGILHVTNSQSTCFESYSQTMQILLNHIVRESVFTYRLTAQGGMCSKITHAVPTRTIYEEA